MSFSRGAVCLAVVDNAHRGPRKEYLKIFRTNDVAVVDKDWVLESLGSYTIQPIMPWLQHVGSEKEMLKAGYDHKLLEEPQSCVL